MTGDQNVLGGGGSSLLGGGGGLNLGGLGGGQPQQFGGAGTSLLGGGTSALGGLGGAPIGGGGGMLMGGMVGGLAQQQQQQQQVGGLSAKQPQTEAEKIEALMPLIVKLTDADQRENVLLELSKKREDCDDLAPVLWHTFGTVAGLLQEIVSIYPLLSPPTLTAHASNRVCNALALLQCVASHKDTRSLFLSAHIPLYLYPFLNTDSKSRPFEYLRLTSLGVIGALVKMDDPEVISFLLQTEIIPLCLRIMGSGSELSKTVATFIVQKILLDNNGLAYVCTTSDRFFAVSKVLSDMVNNLITNPSVRLLKHCVRCYLRLTDNPRAREALRTALPQSLRDETFLHLLRDDITVRKWLAQLLQAVNSPTPGVPGAAGGNDVSGLPGGSSVLGGLNLGGTGGGLGGGV